MRKGTWLVLIAIIFFVISVVLIGVFWGFWYSHAVNFPLRIIAITLLVLALSFFICGLISNYLMSRNSDFKQILGSPLRKSTYCLIVTLFMLVIASDLITVYYTYWENRWVNTPLIIIAIVFYFFGGIGFIVTLKHICTINLIRYGFIEEKDAEVSYDEKSTIRTIVETQSNVPKIYMEEQTLTNELNLSGSNATPKNFRKKLLKPMPRKEII